MSLLASQWMIFPLPQSDLHRMISVMDVHGVEANAQTQPLVPRILHLHEYWALMPFFCAIYPLYLYAQTPLSLSTSAYGYSRTHHDSTRLLRLLMIIMFCICFLMFTVKLAFYYDAKKHNEESYMADRETTGDCFNSQHHVIITLWSIIKISI